MSMDYKHAWVFDPSSFVITGVENFYFVTTCLTFFDVWIFCYCNNDWNKVEKSSLNAIGIQER